MIFGESSPKLWKVLSLSQSKDSRDKRWSTNYIHEEYKRLQNYFVLLKSVTFLEAAMMVFWSFSKENETSTLNINVAATWTMLTRIPKVWNMNNTCTIRRDIYKKFYSRLQTLLLLVSQGASWKLSAGQPRLQAVVK